MIKKTAAFVLLGLAAASAAWLLVRHVQPARFTAVSTALERRSPLCDDRLVVVYFHTHERCANCLRIEAWTRAAVQAGFAAELAEGRVELASINFDLPVHRHFAETYRLLAPMIVLVEMRGATAGDWSAAPDVWNLLDDQPAFTRYMQSEVRRRLDGAPTLQTSAAASLWMGLLLACWLGLQTAISPCPMASNIAAMAFLSRVVGGRRRTLLAALLYVLGRTAAYVSVAVLLLAGLGSHLAVSAFLRRTMSELLGPTMIVVAVLMLDLLPLRFTGVEITPAFHQRVKRWGLAGAFFLGLLFALTFCPYSAALFFSLIPLASQYGSWLAMPAVYGITTALPVAGLAVVLAISMQGIGRTMRRLRSVERVTRLVAGVVFLAVGLYFTFRYVL